MGTAIWNQLLQMNLIGVYGILLAFAVRLLLRRAGSRYCYALWIVVFLNLVLPTVLTGSFSLIPRQLYQVGFAQDDESLYGTSAGDDRSALADETSARETAETGYHNSLSEGSYYDLRNGAVDEVVDVASETMSGTASASGEGVVFTRCLLMIWLSVAAALFLMEGIQYRKTRRRLKALKRTGVDEGNRVVTLDGLETPLLFGFWRPTIYLPDQLKEEERDYILRHELYHRRRKDPVVKALALCISILYWYNPLVWAAFHFLGIDMELSCDEAVLMQADTDIRKAYAGSLLKYGALQNHYILTSLTFGEPGLKTRVKHVLQFQKRGVIITIAAVLAVVLLAVGLFVRPATEETSETLSGEEQSELAGPLAHTADQVQYFAAALKELDEEDYCQILTIGGYSILLTTNGTYDTSWERGTEHGAISAEVSFPTIQVRISSMGTAYPLQYNAEGIYVGWNTGIHTIYTLEEESGELTTESRGLKEGEADTLYDIPFVTKKDLLEETGVLEEQLKTWAEEAAETNAEDDQTTMTVERLVSVIMSGEIASYDYGACENAVLQEPADDPETYYHVFYDLEYQGVGYRLWVEHTRASGDEAVSSVFLERTTTGIPYILYERDEAGTVQQAGVTGLYTFLSEAGIEDYVVSIDLPDGYTFGSWDAKIGCFDDDSDSSGGGVLIEPVAYELQEEYKENTIVADWQYYAGFFSVIREGFWSWEGDTLMPGTLPQGNHMESAYVEMLEGTSKTAYLMEVQYDLYTAAGQAAIEESGLDLSVIATVSEYWYIIFVDDGAGATTGYCLGLAQNLFTKEEAAAIAQSVVFME